MPALRIVGFVAAALMLILAARGFRRRDLRLPDAVIIAVLAVALGVVSVAPGVVDPVLRSLGFPPGDARRVIGLLVISNLLTYLLLLRAFAKIDGLERTVGQYADRVATRFFEGDHPTSGSLPPSPGQGSKEGLPAEAVPARLSSSAPERPPAEAVPARPSSSAPERVDHRPAGKIAVVIPALDEEESLPGVLALVPSQVDGLPVEPIVVSDGSTDATERVACDHGALVVARDLRRGQGATVILGYRIALLRGATVVATVDADGQYDPRELPQLVAPILAGDADVVHGSRSLGSYEMPLRGRAHGVKIFAWIMTRLTGSAITDPASGFRAFTPQALELLEFRENQFHASEVTIAAAKQGLRIREVPCTFRERYAGTTKKPPFFRYGMGYARTLVRTWLH
jgi:hypothetical protein